MNLPRYEVETIHSSRVFEFVSEGVKGKIPKLIKYTETNIKGYYNLAFGDKDQLTGEINDSVITNNGDTEKVLATVVATVYAFTAKHPDCYVFAAGSSATRNRLYRIGITKFLLEIELDFDIFGLVNDEWEPFKKGTHYDAFLVYRKNS
jgi:hypothetical protein